MRCRQRQAHAPHAADRQADQSDPLDVQMIEQDQSLTRKVIQRRRTDRHWPGLAVSPQVQGYHTILLRQRGDLRCPHGLVPQVTTGQQNRRAAALIDVVKGLSIYRYVGHRLSPRIKMEPED
ncbi:hypothetical protein D3C80_372710 [compost metagenome]